MILGWNNAGHSTAGIGFDIALTAAAIFAGAVGIVKTAEALSPKSPSAVHGAAPARPMSVGQLPSGAKWEVRQG